MAHARQSRPDSGLGVLVKGSNTFLDVPSSLGSGGSLHLPRRCRVRREQLKDFRTENGSSQGQNLALTVLSVPNSLDSGWAKRADDALP